MTPLDGVPPVAHAYLLAGRARRLRNKFLLPVEGETIVGREVRTLRSLGLEVTVVAVERFELSGVPFLGDPYDRGPLGGLVTILEVTEKPFFLFGADMPFLDVTSLRIMQTRFRGKTLIPVDGAGTLQVLHGIYSGQERSRALRLLERGAGLRDLVAELASTGDADLLAPGTVAEDSFRDVDTIAEYDALSRQARG